MAVSTSFPTFSVMQHCVIRVYPVLLHLPSAVTISQSGDVVPFIIDALALSPSHVSAVASVTPHRVILEWIDTFI
jgi:hypothetical protein